MTPPVPATPAVPAGFAVPKTLLYGLAAVGAIGLCFLVYGMMKKKSTNADQSKPAADAK